MAHDPEEKVEITTVAVLKSVIESGASEDEWEALTQKGVNVYVNVSNAWKESLNGK